ncbi:MAG: response regulator transcription factor [Paludibacteraceae bacterium]|nr:response regulator transcription factor [Paludibacteraceae bacterium]MBO7636206.1 response regulator transcription factor [Paludibacteraceae bacterium]MBR5972796.1 response regulator transcription factor [Paludibacteraceae bacterium]
MTLDCIIIDDEPLALGLMESYVKKTPFLNLVAKFENAVEAMSTLKENPPHLLFLDIQMPELNGLEFSKIIKDKTKIIFTTAFQQYALEGYKVNALDYLMKPISYPDFLEAANKALAWYEMANTEHKEEGATENRKRSIFVKSDYKLVQIELDKITHIEGLKDYVKIFVEGEQYPILSLMSMKSLETMLPQDQFIRVHRSFIVQPKKIKTIERNRIIFGKEYIPISDSYKDSFQAFLNKYSIL